MRFLKGIAFVIVLLTAMALPAQAWANDEQNIEVVVILDSSHSMRQNDTNRLALDSVKQFINSLPSNYQIGFVVFNTEVIHASLPGTDRNLINKAAGEVSYAGYTNTGAALETVLAMFSGSSKEKIVLLISDGEISMPTNAQTQEATAIFADMLQESIAQGVKIHTIGLGDGFGGYDNSIKEAALITGGELYEAATTAELTQIINSLIFENFGVRRISVGAAHSEGGQNNFSFKLPSSGLNAARVLLTTSEPLNSIVATCSSAGIEVVSGERFAVIAINAPAGDDVSIEFSSA